MWTWQVWSEERCYSGWIKWLLSSDESHRRNMRLITEFALLKLLAYLVGTWLIENDKDKWKKSAIIIKSSLMEEWCKKDKSHRLSLMLKSPAIIGDFGYLLQYTWNTLKQSEKCQNIYSLTKKYHHCWKMKQEEYLCNQ